MCGCSLGPLVKKIKDNQIEVIINSLCSNMFSSSERLRDISSVGLKTVISEFPRTTQAMATAASRNITEKMVDAIGKPVSGGRWDREKKEFFFCIIFVESESVCAPGDIGHSGRSYSQIWRYV